MRTRVLLAVEDIDLRAKVANTVLSAGHALELAESKRRALDLASECKFHLAIISQSSGSRDCSTFSELCQKIPKILFLVGDAKEVVEFGHLKPPLPEGRHEFFSMSRTERMEEELSARLAKIIAVATGTGDLAEAVRIFHCVDNVTVDLSAHIVIDTDGRQLTLTHREVALLRVLARNPGVVLSRDELRRAVSGRSADPYDRSIDMLVARLRRKIERDPKAPQSIVTVAGAGYKLLVSDINKPTTTELALAERRQLTPRL
jgi:DNA-binding response OmpR family regulator